MMTLLAALALLFVPTAFGQQVYQDPVTGQLFEMRPITAPVATVPQLLQTSAGPMLCAPGPRGLKLRCEPVAAHQAAPANVAAVLEQRIVFGQAPVATNSFPAYGVQQTAPIIIATQPDDTVRIASAIDTRDFDLMVDLAFPKPEPKRKKPVSVVHYHDGNACSTRH